jgi:nucleoside permease NupC
MTAAANIFVGMSEAPLMIMPLIPKMTTSELHAVLTGGFATMAGSKIDLFFSYLFIFLRIYSCDIHFFRCSSKSFNCC